MLRAGVRMDDALKRVAELTAEAACEVPVPTRPQVSPGKKRRASAAKKAAVSPPEADAVSSRAEAVLILEAEPGISGSELGRRLGKTERYGQMLKGELTQPAPATGEQPRVPDR